MTEKRYLYAWIKPTTDYDDHYIIKSMPNDKYIPDDNVKVVARFIIDTLPGNTVDKLFDSMASRIIELNNNGYVNAEGLMKDSNWLSSQLRSALIDIYNK